MRLVLYTHPAFLRLTSQDLYARSLAEAFRLRGHTVEVRRPEASVRRWVGAGRWAKWAGYVDQYLLFRIRVRRDAQLDPPDTLYVFCDQALGPWVRWLAHRPHVVHCHDLLALRSALGDIEGQRTSWTGRLYQRWIRRGFRHARHFISISEQTRQDLHRFGGVAATTSSVVYNGLNHPYQPMALDVALARLRQAGLPADERRCLLHVGGGQWYKNTAGVIDLYARHVAEQAMQDRVVSPLWMVSPPPDATVSRALALVPPQGEVQFFSGLDAATLEALYSHARVLLFPSLAEGFGWPIAEALACGCPVITTNAAPMTEVGGPAAFYLPRRPPTADAVAWTQAGARLIGKVLDRPTLEVEATAQAGQEWAARFDADAAIDAYLVIYERLLAAAPAGP